MNDCVAKRKKKGKRDFRKKDKAKLACYNYGKARHFVRGYAELKKVLLCLDLTICLISSTVFIAHSLYMWIVDSQTTDHIIRYRNEFMEYRRILVGKKVYMGNDSNVDMLGTDTYKLEM